MLSQQVTALKQQRLIALNHQGGIVRGEVLHLISDFDNSMNLTYSVYIEKIDYLIDVRLMEKDYAINSLIHFKSTTGINKKLVATFYDRRLAARFISRCYRPLNIANVIETIYKAYNF